jgi:hypothetical protein
LDNAEQLLSFAETAKHRFESGNLAGKMEMLACLGSNLLRANQNKKLWMFYTHCEVVLGISGQEFAWNFDFSIEQNQRLSNAKSRIW